MIPNTNKFALHSLKLELLLETDDETFGVADPFGAYVRVLRRWEIENYLLEPDELEDILARVERGAPRPKRSNEEVIRDLLNHCEVLIPVMAANILLHENSIRALDHGFGCNFVHRTDIEPEVALQLASKLEAVPGFQEAHQEYVRSIESFGSGGASALDEHWERLNRIIDGKRLLLRIGHRHQFRDEYRFLLAARIREHGKIDSEVAQFIHDVKTHFHPYP